MQQKLINFRNWINQLGGKLERALSETPATFRWFTYAILIVFGASIYFATLIIIWTVVDLELFLSTFCLANDCVKHFFASIDQAVKILEVGLTTSVAIASIGGIYIALQSYLTSARNTALTSHIEHLKVFCDYLDSEIRKRSRLSSEYIDALLLYETIFSQSRSGRTSVSAAFVDFVNRVNTIIEESNEKSVEGVVGGFSYREHQRKMKEHLAVAGIVMHLAPRNDYFETEDQLFSLLQRVSQSFCTPKSVPSLMQRRYH